MLNDRFAVLLSPPNSPRMSEIAVKDDYYGRHALSCPKDSTTASVGQSHAIPSLSSGEKAAMYSYEQSQMIHSPYSHSASSYPSLVAPPPPQPCPQYGAVQPATSDRIDRSDLQASIVADSKRSSLIDSVPTSPASRLTPHSPDSHANQEQDEDELIESGGDEPEETDEKPQMTAAELRAAKRKMKRFRLTHNQTRFLMSEFTRQAHPDAAHRERLAREIPGLTARQVQVWFQNRRAKLKRLTSEDRERMMRSRALPADFDTAQALHSPFGFQPPPAIGGVPVPTTVSYAPLDEQRSLGKSLTVDTHQHAPAYEHYGSHYGSPSGVSAPALGGFSFTPPQSASEQLTPVSGQVSPYVLQQQAAYDRRPPAGIPPSNQSIYNSQAQAQVLPLHDRLNRTTSEISSSPLRANLSYSELESAASQPPQQYGRAASFSEQSMYSQRRPALRRNVSSHNGSEPTSYGLGFCYTQGPSYAQADEQQATTGGVTTADSDHFRRTTVTTVPTTYQPYPPSNMEISHMSQYHNTSSNFHNAYEHSRPTESPSQMLIPRHESQNVYNIASPQQVAVYGRTCAHQPVTDSQSPGHIPPPY